MFSSADESLEDITVKPVHIVMVRNRVKCQIMLKFQGFQNLVFEYYPI